MGSRSKSRSQYIWLKTIFFFFSVIFWLTGVALMGVGAWIIAQKSIYNSLLNELVLTIVPGLMIAAGCVVVVISFCGCCGVIRESRMLLMFFLIMCVLIFLLEAAFSVAVFVTRDKIESSILRSTRAKMNQYGFEPHVTKSIDELQMQNRCCGDTSYVSWNETSWKHSERSGNNSVPDSCCKPPITHHCGKRDHPNNIYYKGCLEELVSFFRENLLILGCVGIGIASIQLLSIAVTVVMLRYISV